MWSGVWPLGGEQDILRLGIWSLPPREPLKVGRQEVKSDRQAPAGPVPPKGTPGLGDGYLLETPLWASREVPGPSLGASPLLPVTLTQAGLASRRLHCTSLSTPFPRWEGGRAGLSGRAFARTCFRFFLGLGRVGPVLGLGAKLGAARAGVNYA